MLLQKDKTFDHTYKKNMFVSWADFGKLSKPVIAAVNGFALGGGCELAMMCDIMVAGDKAKFGQPEINLGVLPGAGGTQRLTRAIGKSKAMYMCLTGEMISAQQAEQAGLVAKIFPADDLVEEAVKIAQKIAAKGHMAAIMTKEAVNASQELSLQEGLRFERRLFHSLFATADQKEGMSAFLEKREAKFQNK
jgi:enoyl-CoA hydratase